MHVLVRDSEGSAGRAWSCQRERLLGNTLCTIVPVPIINVAYLELDVAMRWIRCTLEACLLVSLGGLETGALVSAAE